MRRGTAGSVMDEKDRRGAAPAKARSLKDALSRARQIEADRLGVIADLREAEVARLDLLAEELAPIFADMPHNDSFFDCAVVGGAQPRLWIDMLGFVEMGRDKRSYRLITETRSGRQVLFESADVRAVADRVTDYVAHRMIERERGAHEFAPLPEPADESPPDPAQSGKSDSAAPATDSAKFWQIAFAFMLGVSVGVVGMLVWGLWLTR